MKNIILAALALAVAAALPAEAAEGDTVKTIRTRGEPLCGAEQDR